MVNLIIHFKAGQISQHTPALGQVQLCDVRLDEGSVAVVTVVLPVFLHKVFHEINSGDVFGFGQQVAGVAATETHTKHTLPTTFQTGENTKLEVSPDASSQLQDRGTGKRGQHREDLRQLILCQLLSTRVQHHLLDGGTPGVLLPELCHVCADWEVQRWHKFDPARGEYFWEPNQQNFRVLTVDFSTYDKLKHTFKDAWLFYPLYHHWKGTSSIDRMM